MSWPYQAPRWLGGAGGLGGHLQTIVPALLSRRHPPHATAPLAWRRERWTTPDGDFIDVDHHAAATLRSPARMHPPRLVLFHGLEGHRGSHYVQAFAHADPRPGLVIGVAALPGVLG